MKPCKLMGLLALSLVALAVASQPAQAQCSA